MVRFLVIRFSSIGDIVLTSPVVRCLKQQVEGAEVHFLTKPAFRGILELNPYIDKVITLQESLDATLKELKDEQYDHIIDLHHNLRSLRVKRALGIPAFAFNKLNLEKWLMVNLKVNRLPDVHIVDRYMETLRHFSVENDNKGLDFFTDPSADNVITTLPDAFRNGYIALVIGAKHATKRMPDEKLIELIRLMQLPVVLLGGPEDKKSAEAISSAAGSLVFDAVGQFSLQQSAVLVKQSKFVITHDTGLMHIAAAYKKRIISLWGNTIPGFGMTPYLPSGEGKSFISQVNGLKCRPCSKIGYDKCPKGHFKCMQEQDLSEISRVAKVWWGM